MDRKHCFLIGDYLKGKVVKNVKQEQIVHWKESDPMNMQYDEIFIFANTKFKAKTAIIKDIPKTTTYILCVD